MKQQAMTYTREQQQQKTSLWHRSTRFVREALADNETDFTTGPVGRALGLLAIVLAFVGYRDSQILFYVFAGLCSLTAVTNLRYAWRRTIDRSDRIRSHLSAMIGAGIASHTAFFVFGANRYLNDLLVGHWQLVPWIAPGVVGGVIINVVSRRYVRKPKIIGNS